MRRSPRIPATLFVLACLVWPAALAAPSVELPHRYLPGTLDHGLVVATSIDGTTSWAAWSYRNGGEFDVALSVAAADESWSEPRLLGEADGTDQSHPTLLADAAGGFHLVYEDSRGAILLSSLPAGASDWTPPAVVARRGIVTGPSLSRVVGDRLVIAFTDGGVLRMIDLPLTGEVVSGRGLNDGPDPVENEREGGDDQGRQKRDHERGATLHPVGSSVPSELTLLPLVTTGRKLPDTP